MKTFKNFNKKGILIMMVGLSGSGKGYYIKNRLLEDFPDVVKIIKENNLLPEDVIVCPDDIRREVTGDISNQFSEVEVWTIARKRTSDVLKNNGVCIFDAVNISNKSRKSFLKTINCRKKYAVIFKPDPELSKERIKRDIESGVDRSNVPEFVIDKQFDKFKTNLVKDGKWSGEWNAKIKEKIKENLKEFDEIKFAS